MQKGHPTVMVWRVSSFTSRHLLHMSRMIAARNREAASGSMPARPVTAGSMVFMLALW